MAALTAEQLEAELKRKAAAGIAPTNSANTERYNQIKTSIQNQVQPKPAQPAQQPFRLDPGQSYVRRELEGAGFTNIGYDKGRNMVTAGGMDVLQPDKVVNGSSIASGDRLKQAISQIRERENQKKQQDLYTRLESMLGSAPKPQEFNYNAEADPVYQAALRRAGANAQTATGNAMAEMNRRGLLNSTIMGDRAAQIQQGEYGRVSDEILPQLIQQAYGRYRDTYSDQYQQYRDQVGDVGNLLSTTNQLGQQALDNQFRDQSFDRGVLESDRAFDRGVLESDRQFEFAKGQQEWENTFNSKQFDWQKAQQAWENTFQEKNFQQEMKEAAAARGLQWANLKQNQKEFIAQQAFREKEFKYQQDQDVIANDLAKQKLNSPGDYDYKSDPDFAEDAAAMVQEPIKAREALRANAQAYIDKYGVEGYNYLITTVNK
ncbi:hypothetical protein [Paenibacillus prosopidis]|uniref:Uncharacterized protein n=1 Tax=Paenibacillus prosopidis TaxID=630520 RepID=A0A368VSR4_9BACL|nr:hypothetical protein [Paenibacillus prosopidis]RCW44214.1 hypothetical protein DFP97_11278 [Paenibacillus prosopidis]